MIKTSNKYTYNLKTWKSCAGFRQLMGRYQHHSVLRLLILTQDACRSRCTGCDTISTQSGRGLGFELVETLTIKFKFTNKESLWKTACGKQLQLVENSWKTVGSHNDNRKARRYDENFTSYLLKIT
eukprot:1195711-Prorocentrum_minimum.AAC.2